MFLRKFVAAVAVSSALVLGTTGCSMTSNIPTLQEYAPSDGAQASFDGVKALNLIYLTKDISDLNQREVGALIGTFVNTTNHEVELKIQYSEDGSDATDVLLAQQGEVIRTIPAGGKLEFGYNETLGFSALLLNKAGSPAKPGQLTKLTLSITGGTENVILNVPALDGSLEQYSALVQNLEAAQDHVEE